jgi:hypothetical protein
MDTTITSNWRPFSRALYACLIAIAALCAIPINARAPLYVINFPDGAPRVSKCDTTTGAVIKADFIPWLFYPEGLALSGNTLFAASEPFGFVGQVDATTGAPAGPSSLNLPYAYAIAAKSEKAPTSNKAK